MSVFEIPLRPQNQQFTVVMSGVQYGLVVRWNKFIDAWSLDCYNTNGAPLFLGIPLVTGTDIVGQFAYLGIGGQFIVQSDGVVDAVPTYENLGSVGHLYYRTPSA